LTCANDTLRPNAPLLLIPGSMVIREQRPHDRSCMTQVISEPVGWISEPVGWISEPVGWLVDTLWTESYPDSSRSVASSNLAAQELFALPSTPTDSVPLEAALSKRENGERRRDTVLPVRFRTVVSADLQPEKARSTKTRIKPLFLRLLLCCGWCNSSSRPPDEGAPSSEDNSPTSKSPSGRSPSRAGRVECNFWSQPTADEESDADVDYEKEVHLLHGDQLINELIAQYWNSVCEWFSESIKDKLEPILQQKVLASCELVECELGTAPPKIRDISIARASQMCPEVSGEGEHRNVKIMGDVSQALSCTISITASVGTVTLREVNVQGRVLVELVRLCKRPPWFSGVRVCFPDAPSIDISVETEAALGMDAFIDFKTRVEQIVAERLLEVIKNRAVLPNCIAHSTSPELDFVFLKNAHPQGVLRIKLLDSVLHSDANDDILHVEVSVGSHIAQLPPLGAKDFIVIDKDRQNVRLKFVGKKGDVLGSAVHTVAELGESEQDSNDADVSSASHVKRIFIASSESAFRRRQPCIRVQAIWRSFVKPRAEEVTRVLRQCNSIRKSAKGVHEHGKPKWMLLVDLLHATNLPAKDATTMYWASLVVEEPRGVHTLSDSLCVTARTPMDDGMALLTRKLIAQEFREMLQKQLTPEQWRTLLHRSSSEIKSDPRSVARDLVDASWQHRFHALVAAERSMIESIRNTKLVITVWCSGPGQNINPKANKVALGHVNYQLSHILNKMSYHDDVSLDMEVISSVARAHVRFRVHVCPLEFLHGDSSITKGRRHVETLGSNRFVRLSQRTLNMMLDRNESSSILGHTQTI